MPERTVEDRLREEYADLLPVIRKVAGRLESEVRFHLLPISASLDRFEQIEVRARIKECESAVDSLRRRQEGATWEIEHSALYKPTPRLRGIAQSLEMRECSENVLIALDTFAAEFERLIRNHS